MRCFVDPMARMWSNYTPNCRSRRDLSNGVSYMGVWTTLPSKIVRKFEKQLLHVFCLSRSLYFKFFEFLTRPMPRRWSYYTPNCRSRRDLSNGVSYMGVWTTLPSKIIRKFEKQLLHVFCLSRLPKIRFQSC